MKISNSIYKKLAKLADRGDGDTCGEKINGVEYDQCYEFSTYKRANCVKMTNILDDNNIDYNFYDADQNEDEDGPFYSVVIPN